MTIYRGLSGVNREIKEQYRGVDGVNRAIKEQYRGYGGVNQKVFDAKILDTDFSTKGSGWIEEGGSFNYGVVGLNVNVAAAKGTLAGNYSGITSLSTEVMRCLTIPVGTQSLSTFSLEFDTVLTTSGAGQYGRIVVLLCNGNTSICAFHRADNWGGDDGQEYEFYEGRFKDGAKFYDSDKKSGLNGVPISFKLTCNGGVVAYYANNVPKITTNLASLMPPVNFDNVKILFMAGADYDAPTYTVSSMKLVDSII